MKYLTTTLSVALCCMSLGAATASAQDRTLKEFKEYVESRLDGLSEAQIDRIASVTDKDNDGTISETEFADRIQAIQTVMLGEGDADADQPAKPDMKKDEKSADAGEASESDTDQPFPVVTIEPLTGSSDAPVLLITADEIAKAWLPFAQWKTANGKLTKITTVGQIREKYEADSIQEKIRLCVRDHIDNHKTRWVILGGDSLPGGKGLVPGGHMTVHPMEPDGIPTDIVYLSPTNWDADNDGVYGEWDEDRDAITYPDGCLLYTSPSPRDS